MSFVLQEHQQRVSRAVETYRSEIVEIEGHLRLRAMANNCTDAELLLLHRLKQEKAAMLERYSNLSEAFKAILGSPGIAAE
jgi:hypothetical protein